MKLTENADAAAAKKIATGLRALASSLATVSDALEDPGVDLEVSRKMIEGVMSLTTKIQDDLGATRSDPQIYVLLEDRAIVIEGLKVEIVRITAEVQHGAESGSWEEAGSKEFAVAFMRGLEAGTCLSGWRAPKVERRSSATLHVVLRERQERAPQEFKKDSAAATIEKLNRFAEKHGVVLLMDVDTGMRPCVGFAKTSKSKGFIAHNPMNMTTFDTIPELKDERLKPPDEVNAYHEFPSLVVLVDEDTTKEEALAQLAEWAEHLESQGDLEVVEYDTGANRIQAMLSGTKGWAIRYKEPA